MTSNRTHQGKVLDLNPELEIGIQAQAVGTIIGIDAVSTAISSVIVALAVVNFIITCSITNK